MNEFLIPLSRGKFTEVSEEDYDYLMQWKWYCSGTGYACRDTGGRIDKHRIRMHNIIAERLGIVNPGHIIDHIDINPLNNTRSNLRVATHQENRWNVTKRKNNTSGFKGVSFHKACSKWRAFIKVNYKQIFLGYFHDPIEAAKAYDEAASFYFGKFANLNFKITEE